MKKYLDAGIIIWLILFLFFIGTCVYYFYYVSNEEDLVVEKATQYTKQEGIYYNNGKADHPFVIEGDIEDDTLFYAASYYYAIPEAIRTAFRWDGWQVVLTDKDISKEYYNGPINKRLAGLTDTPEKRIYVHSRKADIRRAMIHEFGHFFDYSTDMSSVSKTFKKICEDEKRFFKEKWKTDNHSTSNEQEYFAETFAQYLLYPDMLKKNCPETFNYMDSLFKEHNNEKDTL